MLKKRPIAALVAAVLALSMLAGCAGTTNGVPNDELGSAAGTSAALSSPDSGTQKSEVVVAISSEPESGFDPTKGWGHGLTPLVQSTLVEYTQGMEIVNDLATGYDVSDDGLTWTFTLREDAYFTDGEQLTAADVVFTFETTKTGATAQDLSYMTACEATDDFTVTFTLDAPTSTFLNTVASLGIVPQHAYGEDYADHPIGTGPWVFEQWNKGEQVIFSANEDYYGDVPQIKKVTLVFMDEDAAFAAAMGGQVDVALTSATHATQTIDGMRLEAVTTVDNRGMTMPMQPDTGEVTQSGHPVGNDVTSSLAIRQALAYGLDRAAIAEGAVNGYADPCYSENDGMPWNNPDVKLETDVDKAVSLLEEDGWEDSDGDGIREKDGLKAEFSCIYPSGDSVRQAVAMAAAEQAKALGISILVEGISWDEISKRMFSSAVLMGWGSSNPYTSYLLFHSDNKLQDDYYNPEGLDSAVVDGYLEAALHAGSTQDANEQWRQAQWDGETGTAMQGECPWVWLVNVQHLYYVREGLDIGQQQLHAHGASWPLVQNLKDWRWGA